MTPITDTEINERLAKGMGWNNYNNTWWQDDKGNVKFFVSERSKQDDSDEVWNPCSSLDQMHLVENRLIELGLWDRYAVILWTSLNGSESHDYRMFFEIHATARQKALAACRVFEEVGK